MTVTFDAEGVTRKIRAAAQRGVIRATELVRNEMIRLILAGPKSGRLYGAHKASAPGEPPASDTGRLVNSINTRYDFSGPILVGRVSVTAEYGMYLEFGTQTIEPRPFARPAVFNTQAAVASTIAEEIARG